jgi:hypothetical protein
MADFDFTPYRTQGALRPDSMSGMNAAFLDALGRMFAAAPSNIQSGLKVKSGYRSVARQRELWKAALQKYGSAKEARRWVAPPGNSQHNMGFAADLDYANADVRKWVRANAPSFGLSFPLGNENWHIELATARGKKGKGLAALVDRPSLPITPASPPLPTPRPPAPLAAAPVESVRRQPLGPAMPAPLATPSPRPTPGVDPRVLAAYQQMAATRMAAPANPVPRPPSPVQQNPMVPQQPAAPPLGPPRVLKNYPVYQPPVPQTPANDFPPAPSIPGDAFGNTWQDGPQGRAVTNRFGVTTIQRPDGTTAAPGGPFANMDTSKMGGLVKTGLGGGLGAMLGGAVAGPVGGFVGGMIGRELANGRNPMSGGGSGGLGAMLGGLFGGNSRDPWSGARESSGHSTTSSGSSRPSSSGSKRDTRDRPDFR